MGLQPSRHTVYEQVSRDEESAFLREVIDLVGDMPKPRGWTERARRGRPRRRGRGRPPYDWRALVVILLLMQYLGLGYRETAAHVAARPEFRKTLGLRKAPGKSTLHRAHRGLPRGWLEALNARVLARFQKGGVRRGPGSP